VAYQDAYKNCFNAVNISQTQAFIKLVKEACDLKLPGQNSEQGADQGTSQGNGFKHPLSQHQYARNPAIVSSRYTNGTCSRMRISSLKVTASTNGAVRRGGVARGQHRLPHCGREQQCPRTMRATGALYWDDSLFAVGTVKNRP
jgi:hypothetical protein